MAETAKNKVRLTIKNAHVATLSVGEDGAITYATPVPVPGTVNLDLAAVGELTKFYADGIVYWQGETNNGYPESLETEIWPNTKVTTDNVLIENANKTGKSFALLFEIVGDVSARKYCLYNCTAKRTNVGGATSGENKEPQTVSATISAIPMANGDVKAVTCADTPETVINNWYKQVYQPSAPDA